ncbi:MAG: DEAD/DEAH box helicase [Bacteroidota bacterium]
METIKFIDLPLSAEVQQALADMNFTDASPIQAQAIPLLLQGKDMIGQAQTGTGKTAAFGIPVIESIDPQNNAVQALILCPTRELALQVSEEIKKISRHKRIRVAAIYGGESIERQIKDLKYGTHIVVGTPGRVIDHLERRTLKLDQVKSVVLDEADEMLDMGFREDIEVILSRVPEERQTVFFSATMSREILALTKRYQVEPEMVKIQKSELTTPNIEQWWYDVKSRHKVEALTRLVEYYDLKLMLVFCNTKKMVDELVEELNGKGYEAEGLHGDLRQTQRNNVMAKFRSGACNILVATDVAARGIDVDNVDAVFNYDLPLDEEYYVHRIGRTARAGKTGKSFTFIGHKDMGRLRDIQKYTKAAIQRGDIPTAEAIAGLRVVKYTSKVREQLVNGGLDSYKSVIETLVTEGFEIPDIAAALVALSIPAPKVDDLPAYEKFSPEREHRGERGDRERSGGHDRYADRERGPRSFNNDREREPRPERGPREVREPRPGDPKMTRLFFSIGRESRVRPGDIVGAIAGETNIPGNKIGHIDIYDKFTFVEVAEEFVSDVVTGMDNNSIKGRRVNVEVAR